MKSSMYATTCQFHTTKAGTKLLFELHSPQFSVSTAECRMPNATTVLQQQQMQEIFARTQLHMHLYE